MSTPSLPFRIDLRYVFQASCPSSFARIRATVRQGHGELTGEFLDQEGTSQAWLRPSMEGALVDSGLDLHVEALWFHPVDSRERDFERVVRTIVQLAAGAPLPERRFQLYSWEPLDPG